jgi:AcrR family transcriptional regulator
MTTSDNPRRRLLESAGQVFAEEGFEGATVRDICKRAGANIAAVNYYFRDKERLYIEAVKEAACGAKFHSAPSSWPAGMPAAEKLRDFIRVFASGLLDPNRPAWHVRLMMREMSSPTAACAELVRDYIRPTAGILMGVLEELLPPGTPRLKRFLVGMSIVGQCLHHVNCKPVIRLLLGDDYDRLTPAVVADHVAEFSLAALGLNAPPRTASRASATR